MVALTALACIILLGTVHMCNAAPVPGNGNLENLVKAAKYIYDGLNQMMLEARFQENYEEGENTGLYGDGNFNFEGQVNRIHVEGK